MKKTIFAISTITAIAFSNSTIMAGDITYPKTRTVDVTDNYFGTAVADPYRWLENDTTAETAAWVKAQNEITDAYLAKIPFRNALKNRLTELANYEKMGMPSKHNGKYYFYKNNGLQNQSVLYVVDRLGDTPRVMLDPNTLSTDGTVALKQINFSKDGKYLAYTISRSGSDWNEIYVMDTETRQLLSDHIVWAKFTDAQWLGDGFFYSAYDAPDEEGKAFSQKNEFHKIYYHKLGTPQSADRLEFRSFEHPLRFYSAGVSDDERFVFVYESEGDGNAVYVKDLQAETPHYTCVVKSMSQHYSIIGSDNGKIFFLTDDNAPMGKVVYLNANNLKTDAFCDFIAEKDVVINSVEMADHKFIVSYLRDASTHAYLFDSNGNEVREISAPGIGTMAFACDRDEKEVFYSFSSYTVPSAIYRYDIDTDKSELYWRPNVKFNPDLYTTEQLTFASKDGTPVKMFVTYKKGLKRNGKNPVFLYGYGGFNISLNPGFSPYRVPFIENGGIMVVVNLRGGGEYGEAWHLAGTKMQKQNVFDDFIAAAEYLIAKKYTSPQYIACNGGSNGGLLVGAVVNQRPDLFAAAVPQVGVMDMLRYHTFTIGWNWAHDYGRSDDSKEMFEYLRAYSPLHSIKNDGTRYPAILVTTADHDDRVVPAHSFKYAATLQAADTGNAPKLIRIDSKAGHGSGKPISKVIDEYTDIYSFIMQNLGMKYKK